MQMREELVKISPHLGLIFDAALSITNLSNPLRHAFGSLAYRELFREYFARLAPDDYVKKCCWYTPPDDVEIVSRRDRVRFAIYGYVSDAYFPTPFIDNVDRFAGEFIQKVDQLSKLVHVTASSLETPETEQQQILNDAVDAFSRIVQTIREAKLWFHETLTLFIQDGLNEAYWAETFSELDELSTHTSVEGVSEVEVEIDDIYENTINFSGAGRVECRLQMGSDSDFARDNGLRWSESYPFTFSGTADVRDPGRIRIDKEDIDINTSSYYK